MNGWLLVSQAGGAIEKPPVELAKEIGSSAGLAEELEIDPMTEETVEVSSPW